MLTEKQAGMIKKLAENIRPDFLHRLCTEKDIPLSDEKAVCTGLARYYRQKPDTGLSLFSLSLPYDAVAALAACGNTVTVINIPRSFPDGHIDYFFNPTYEKPPVNHEWLWQLNRHSFWKDMALAYAATGNECYAAAFETQLMDWVEQTFLPEEWNGPGSAWRTIECGLRLMGSWQIAFSAFRRSRCVSDEAFLLMLQSMYEQAQHLLAHHTGGNNWVMMEMAGVYTFAALFPEFVEAEQMRKAAGNLLAQELAAQILPDGMQYELSPDYHVCVFECAANVYLVAKAAGLEKQLPPEYETLLKRMTEAYIQLATPVFTQPKTNDCYTMYTAQVVQLAQNLFPGNEVYRYVLTDRADGVPPTGITPSAFLPYAGFCVMRNTWQRDAAYLCFDVGPLGKNHMHQDMLNIILYKGGQELLCDDGGGQYEISSMREYALSAADHNTVLVDGMGQNRPGPLVAQKPARAAWHTDERYDYACAVYDGAFGEFSFEKMGGGTSCPAVHTRQVRFCKPDFFVVRDDLTTKDGKAHSYELRFQMNTVETRKEAVLPGGLRGCFEGEYDLLMIPVDGQAETCTAVSGQMQPSIAGWYNGRNESDCHKAATVLRRVENTKNHTFITLLFPIRKSGELPVIEQQGNRLFIRFNGNEYSVRTDDLSEP